LGILIVTLLLVGIVSLPLALFKEHTLVGIYVRANAPLVAVMAAQSFASSFDTKRPSMLMASASLIYAMLSIGELFRRKGRPIIEWVIIIAGVGFFSSPDNRYMVYLVISLITFIFAYSSRP
jgi:hypothetical protein